MNDLSPRQKEQVFELRQGWIALAVLLLLCGSRLAVEHWLGEGWAIGMAVIAALAWSVIRPWRFGLLRQETRRGIKLMGLITLWGFVLVAVLSYLRYGRH